MVRLQVHLPGYKSVYFREGEEHSALDRATAKDSTLEAYFKLNTRDESARSILYHDISKYYVFKKESGRWEERQIGHDKTLGRMYIVSPRDEARYFLRLLLVHVPGARSDQELRTVDGVVCETYREAARLRGLLADKSAWIESITEAARVRMPRELRRLYVLILVFGTPADPLAIRDRFWEELSDDFVRTHGELAGKDAAL